MNIRILIVLFSFIFTVPLFSMEQPSLDQAVADSFETKFFQSLADIDLLQEVAQEYDGAGEEEDSYHAMNIVAELHHNLDMSLIARSTNKWLLTGDTLSLKLRLMDVLTFESQNGLSIEHFLELKNPLNHLVSHHQVFNSCGFNSLANAYALERQVREGLPITAACTRKYAEHCFAMNLTRSFVFQSLLCDEGIDYADASQINEAALELLKKYNNLSLHLIFMSLDEIAAFQDEMTQAPIVELIKANPAVHFIINIGREHWVLVSVIHESARYAMYHLNSANDPIDEGQLKDVLVYIDGLIEGAKK